MDTGLQELAHPVPGKAATRSSARYLTAAAWQTVRAGWRRLSPSLLFALVLSLAMFGDVFFGHALLSHANDDITKQYLHWRQFAFSELAKGHFPLWNPYIYGGAPFFSGFQATLLYPLNWTYLVLPLTTAMNLEVALHIGLGGFFMDLWASARGLSRTASHVAAAVFMFSAPFFGHLYPGHLSNLATMAWTPAVFLLLDRLVARPSFGVVLLAAGAIALQILGGHPQYFYYSMIIAGLYLVSQGRRIIAAPRCIPAIAASYLIAAALAAVQLLAGLGAAMESARSGTSYEFASSFHFTLEGLISYFVPIFHGGFLDRPYSGPFLFWEMSLSIGVIGGLLALLGGASAWRQRDWTLLVPPLAALALALGKSLVLWDSDWLPATFAAALPHFLHGAFKPYDLLFNWLPGLSMFRGISKFVFFVALFGALLAGRGLERLTALPTQARARLGWSLMAVAVALGTAMLWIRGHYGAFWPLWRELILHYDKLQEMVALNQQISGAFMTNASETAVGGCLVSAGIIFAFGAACVAARRRAVLVLATLAIAEAGIGSRIMWRATQQLEARTDDVARVTEELGALLPQARYHLIGHANLAMTVERHEVWGDDPFVLRRYAEFVAFTQGMDPDKASQDLSFSHIDSPLLRLLRFVPIYDEYGRYTPATDPRAVDKAPLPPLPRFKIMHRIVIAAGRDQIFAELSQRIADLDTTVVLEDSPAILPAESTDDPVVHVKDEGTDFVDLETTLAAPGVLVMSDAYSKDWRAVAGSNSSQASYQVVPADYVLRGVPLAAGYHRLRLEYRPLLYVVGKWISIVVALLFASVGATLARRRWRLALAAPGAVPARSAPRSDGAAPPGEAASLSRASRFAIIALGATGSGLALVWGLDIYFGLSGMTQRLEPGFGFRQPFRGEPSDFLDDADYALKPGAKLVLLGNAMSRAGEVRDIHNTFAGKLGAINAGIDEVGINHVKEFYLKFVRPAAPRQVGLVISPEDIASSRVEAILRQVDYGYLDDPRFYGGTPWQRVGAWLSPLPATPIADADAVRRNHRASLSDVIFLGRALDEGTIEDWGSSVLDIQAQAGPSFFLALLPISTHIEALVRGEPAPPIYGQLARWAMAHHVPLLDLRAALAVEDYANTYRSHTQLSVYGHQLVARALERYLVGTGVHPSVRL